MVSSCYLKFANINFVHSGRIIFTHGDIREAGQIGDYWTLTSANRLRLDEEDLGSYNLCFNATGGSGSCGPDGRHNAYPIRCLAY